MRNSILGLMVFALGLGVGTGIGLSLRRVQPEKAAYLSPPPEPSSTESGQKIGLSAGQNPLATHSDDSIGFSETEAPNERWLAYRQETEDWISDLEQRVMDLESADEPEPVVRPPRRNVLNESSLQQAGFDEIEVTEIAEFYNRQQLERLELRDKAIREGWIDSDEFSKAIRALSGQSQLLSSLGESRYDQFLLSQGRSNRVRIDQVMSGSSAQSSGVLAGDVISRYAETKIFTVSELQVATTEGERDELVTLWLLRDGEEVQLVVPRGPLGVTVSSIQVEVEN